MVIAEVIKKAMLAGLGAQEKAREFVEELVKAGEEFDKRAKDTVTNILEKLNIPSRDDIEKLEKKVQALNGRLKKLEGGASEE
jgi:polyhydroxyalkanoate synthesis regulator phasin